MPARIVSRAEWLLARQAHLQSEKALTRVRDLIAAERRSLRWVRIAEGASGRFRAYSSYVRGNEEVIGAFIYLDITPKRNENEIMDWVKRHDEYAAAEPPCCQEQKPGAGARPTT